MAWKKDEHKRSKQISLTSYIADMENQLFKV
jgi:hypothetical protein